MNAPAVQRPDPADTPLSPEAHSNQPRQLVLLGAGMAHLQLLHTLARKPLPEVQVTLVAAETHVVHPAMGPGLVAGDYQQEDCTIPLEPLVKRAGIRWLQQQPVSLDAAQQTLALGDGSTQHYEWLSINAAPAHHSEQLEQTIPGAGKFGLCVYPLETWAQRWQGVSELAAKKALRVAVIGDHPVALELALAVQQRLPSCVVTVLMRPDTAGPPLATAGTTRLLQQLKAQRITVLHDTALQIDASAVHLGCGAQLACDVPLLALQHLPHAWLAASGLALNADGQAATDGYLRSSSHPQVWVANGDSASLLRHLQAVARGARLPATARQPGAGFQLLFGGSQQAVMAWGRYSATGRAWHWLKDWWDRRQLRRYTM